LRANLLGNRGAVVQLEAGGLNWIADADGHLPAANV
jgi:hypothetical protein